MTRIHGTAAGIVTRRVEVPANGTRKAFWSVEIELAPKEYNAKQYKERVSIRSVGDPPTRCQVGAIVSVSGEVSGSVIEAKGKHYARMTIYGRIEIIDDAPKGRGTEPLPSSQCVGVPIPKSGPLAPKNIDVATAPAPWEGGDDSENVPF